MKINNLLTINDNLNEKFWAGERGERLNSEVSWQLLLIARDFFNDLKLDDVKLEDVTFTGSLANYNYTKFSDVDLHLIVDFNKVDENKELVRNFFSAKTSNWNKKHNITVFGYEIEIYVQDMNEDHHSTGVFSIMNNEWIAQPNRIEPEIDEQMAKRKIKSIIDMIERTEDVFEAKKFKQAHLESKSLIKKIKKFRQSGLEERGEYSYENLAFKYLRNYEHMKRLFDIRDESYDKMRSYEGKYDKKFKIYINNDEILEKPGFDRLNEIEIFQKRVRDKHNRLKNLNIGRGKQKAGSAYPNKPNYNRGKSAPPGFGGV
tara:strand:+ start:11349 stop:12299 length:951 start_codon:yes stop_codon:yes gene_type:complete